MKNLPTEAQFEAQLRPAITAAFPWLSSDGIVHQKSFSFKFGHAAITIEGNSKKSARARLDVLVSFESTNLAIFELKRPGIAITDDDRDQGLSYARMLHPQPPLVVVSNGSEVLMYETHSGNIWEPPFRTHTALKTLIENSAKVAESSLKDAITTLMGNNPDVWMQAVREVTQQSINELTGSWANLDLAFVENFTIPRKATGAVLKALSGGDRLVTVESEPFLGKSHVLRECAERTSQGLDMAVLYLDADVGIGIFEQLGRVLSDVLNWPLTGAEAEHWLKNLSNSDGPRLILAIDHIGPERGDLWRNLETLTSDSFGGSVGVLLALDDTVAEEMMQQRSGRAPSRLRRRAVRLGLNVLDNQEFSKAETALLEHRLGFVKGAKFSEELRVPWLLRVMAAHPASSPIYENENLVAAMSPVPGMEVLEFAKARFDLSQAPFNRYRELAQAILTDVQDNDRAYQLKLELSETFLVRRTSALELLEAYELTEMVKRGLVRETKSEAGDNVLAIRLPHLMAAQLAELLAEEMVVRGKIGPEEAADWLVSASEALPMGDVIAAVSLVDAALQSQGLGLGVLRRLLMRPPRNIVMEPGTRVATNLGGNGIVNMTLGENGKLLVELDGVVHEIEPDEDEIGPHRSTSDFQPFLILSHLAGHQFEAVAENQISGLRADPALLLEVGSSPTVLRRARGEMQQLPIPTHGLGEDGSVVCHFAGVIEPITWSLVRFLGREKEEMRDQFIEMATSEIRPALLVRLDLALRQTAGSSDKVRAKWARLVRQDIMEPLLREHVSEAVHS